MLNPPLKLFSEESELCAKSPNPAANPVQVFVDRQQESCVCVIAVGQFNAKEELGVAAISGEREVAGADLEPCVLAVEQQDDLGMKHYVRDFQQVEGKPVSRLALPGVDNGHDGRFLERPPRFVVISLGILGWIGHKPKNGAENVVFEESRFEAVRGKQRAKTGFLGWKAVQHSAGGNHHPSFPRSARSRRTTLSLNPGKSGSDL